MTTAEHAAREACVQWSLPEPRLLRQGMSALYLAGDVAVRVVPGGDQPQRDGALAVALGRLGVRVPAHVRPSVVADGHTVHALELLHEAGPVDWQTVGSMVRRVHDWSVDEASMITAVPFAVDFPWWQADNLMAEVDDLLDPAARHGLRAAIHAHGDWRERAGALVVCHGDIHPGNVLQTAEGPVLLDWDLLCRAPAAWDHAPMITWEHRWGGESGAYERFAAGYGTDMRGGPLAESLAVMRNVAATLMRLRAGRTDDAAAEEATRRLAYWRGEPDAPQWRAM